MFIFHDFAVSIFSVVVGCSPLDLPLDINVYPATCTSLEKLYYGTECTFFCRNGLTFEGTVPSVSCSADGEWDTDVEATDLKCRGKEREAVQEAAHNWKRSC